MNYESGKDFLKSILARWLIPLKRSLRQLTIKRVPTNLSTYFIVRHALFVYNCA